MQIEDQPVLRVPAGHGCIFFYVPREFNSDQLRAIIVAERGPKATISYATAAILAVVELPRMHTHQAARVQLVATTELHRLGRRFYDTPRSHAHALDPKEWLLAPIGATRQCMHLQPVCNLYVHIFNDHFIVI